MFERRNSKQLGGGGVVKISSIDMLGDGVGATLDQPAVPFVTHGGCIWG